jgi:hypothetical protein
MIFAAMRSKAFCEQARISHGDHLAGAGKMITGDKGGALKMKLDEKNANGLLGDKNKTNNE